MNCSGTNLPPCSRCQDGSVSVATLMTRSMRPVPWPAHWCHELGCSNPSLCCPRPWLISSDDEAWCAGGAPWAWCQWKARLSSVDPTTLAVF